MKPAISPSIHFVVPITNCSYSTGVDLNTRYFLFLVIAPTLSLISIVFNVLSIYGLLLQNVRNQTNFHLRFVALCDIGVVVTATMLYSVEVAYDYFELLFLYRLWVSYLPFVFFLSNTFLMGSVFYTIAATLERWLYDVRGIVLKPRRVDLSVLLIFLGTVMINMVRYFEISITERSSCHGFAQYAIGLASFAQNLIYHTVVSLWLWGFLSLVIPFVVLTFLNAWIIFRFKTRKYYRTLGFAHTISRRNQESDLKEREATILLILVVGLFLCCNTPGVLLTFMERGAEKFLESNKEFYSYARDAVNLLAIFQCCPNFIVYMIFSPSFRHNIMNLLLCRGKYIVFHRKMTMRTEPRQLPLQHRVPSLHRAFDHYN